MLDNALQWNYTGYIKGREKRKGRYRMGKQEIIGEAAKLAGITFDEMDGFCAMADDDIFDTLTPNELKDQYMEYTGQ